MLRALVLLLSATLCAPALGKVYKLVLPDGTVQFTDRPQEGAEEVDLPPVQTFSPPPVPAGGDDDADRAPAPVRGYESIRIASPAPDETIRDNGGTISVSVALEPALQPGHSVEILLDGKSIGSGAATSASVTDVDRGTHTVSAAVKDEDGKTLVTAPAVTFHLKRAALGSAPPRPSPRPAGAGAGS